MSHVKVGDLDDELTRVDTSDETGEQPPCHFDAVLLRGLRHADTLPGMCARRKRRPRPIDRSVSERIITADRASMVTEFGPSRTRDNPGPAEESKPVTVVDMRGVRARHRRSGSADSGRSRWWRG